MIFKNSYTVYVSCKIRQIACLLFVLSLSLNSLKAQNKNIDSLNFLLKKDIADTNKVNHLNVLCSEYTNIGLFDTAIYHGNTALQLAQQLNFKKGIANSYNNMGIVYYSQGDYTKTLDYWSKALKVDEELKNKMGVETRLGNIGLVYWKQSDYLKALDFYFKALKMAEDLSDKKGIARHLANIGNVFNELKDYSKALDYDFKALKIAEEIGNKPLQANILSAIGIVQYNKVDNSKALDYYFKALKMQEELENKMAIAKLMSNIGNIYSAQEDYPRALEYFFKSLKMKEKLGDKFGTEITLGNIGVLYTSLKKYNEASTYLYHALALSDSIGAKDNVKSWYEYLSELYEKSNISLPDSLGGKSLNMEQMRMRAMYYYKRSIAIRDTLFSEENKKQLVRKEMNFEFDKKEAITKAETEKQQAIAEEKNRKQKIITLAVGSGLLLVLVFAGFIFRSLRITNKQKKIIESQKFQIVESINYSKKIQNSLLPNVSDMQKKIAGLFVFYEPKDIVSGDFYYFKEFEKYTLLACVDCTGHGVPGGFMSTMGSLLLDKIVNSELLSPSEILNKLSDEIVRVLHQQDGGEIQDGMDLSICLIDHNNKKIEFSGARNGIIIISDALAKRYKADLLPVGGNYMKKGVSIDRKFKTQSINIAQNDWIYMYTDGFMEQVGGREGVPMNYLQFENELIGVSKKQSPEEKNKFLQTEINNWRGGNERDDDILIMGFQIK